MQLATTQPHTKHAPQAEIDRILEFMDVDFFDETTEVGNCVDIEDIANGVGPQDQLSANTMRTPSASIKSIRESAPATFSESTIDDEEPLPRQSEALYRVSGRSHALLQKPFFVERPYLTLIADFGIFVYENFAYKPLQKLKAEAEKRGVAQSGDRLFEWLKRTNQSVTTKLQATVANWQQRRRTYAPVAVPTDERAELFANEAGIAFESPFFDSLHAEEALAHEAQALQETDHDTDPVLDLDQTTDILTQETLTEELVTDRPSTNQSFEATFDTLPETLFAALPSEQTSHEAVSEPIVSSIPESQNNAPLPEDNDSEDEDPYEQTQADYQATNEKIMKQVQNSNPYPSHVESFAARYRARQAGLTLVDTKPAVVRNATAYSYTRRKNIPAGERGFVAFMTRVSVERFFKLILLVWLVATIGLMGLKLVGITIA